MLQAASFSRPIDSNARLIFQHCNDLRYLCLLFFFCFNLPLPDIMKSKSNPDFLKKDKLNSGRSMRNLRSKVSIREIARNWLLSCWAETHKTTDHLSSLIWTMIIIQLKITKLYLWHPQRLEKIVSCYVNPPVYFTQEFEQLWVNFSVGFPKYILLSLKRFHGPWVIYYFDWSSASLNVCAWSSSLTRIFVHPKFPQNMILKFGIFVSFLFGLQCVSPSSRAACGLTHSQLHEIPV